LNYSVKFAESWSIYDSDWSDGIIEEVFDDGWTEASKADDFVARWKASDGMEAKYVPIEAYHHSDGDQNTQIDGIVAAQVDGAAPEANDDSYSTPMDTTLYVQAGQGVLINDSDPDGDLLAAVVEDNPASGSASLAPEGAFVYTPNTAFVGQDTFTYRASDGQHLSNLATVTIDVQSTSPPGISISDANLTEANANMTFTVSLDAPSPNVVQVDWTTVDGSAEALANDYDAGSGTVTFQPNLTTQQISVAINDDLLDEDFETFTVNLSNPVNAVFNRSVGTGTIDDNDDPPEVSIADVTVAENVSSGKAEFTVSLSEISGKDVTVYYYTSDSGGEHPATAGVDYTEVQSGSLLIEVGQTSATAEVYINNDSLDEYDETFAVTLSSAVNATLGDSDAVGTITDDDAPPVISIADASGLESDGSMLFDVELSAVSGKDVTAYYYTSSGSGSYPATAATDYSEVQDGWLFIAAGQTGTTAEVDINDDYIDEYNETFDVTLTSATNASFATGSATGTIWDDDYYEYLTLDLPATAGSTEPALAESQVQPLAKEAARR